MNEQSVNSKKDLLELDLKISEEAKPFILNKDLNLI